MNRYSYYSMNFCNENIKSCLLLIELRQNDDVMSI